MKRVRERERERERGGGGKEGGGQANISVAHTNSLRCAVKRPQQLIQEGKKVHELESFPGKREEIRRRNGIWRAHI